MNDLAKLSVVVCVRNEEKRIRDCLESIYANDPDEVVVVDGNSSDRTIAIAREFPGIHIIESKGSNLPRDRQKGIDAAKNDLIAMIDGDHRLRNGDLASLLKDLREFDLDMVQSALAAHDGAGFWEKAEESTWDVSVNTPPGVRTMVGTAPAIYTKRLFQYVRFDDTITSTVDDADLMYRISKFPHLKVGMGRTKIRQYHFATLGSYLKKFLMYGKGDGEFCRKHPERAFGMIYHILVRYPVVYSFRLILSGHPEAIPFVVFQGLFRFIGLVRYFLPL